MCIFKKPQVKKILVGILLLGLIARIYISFFTSLPHMHRDSIDYFGQADTLMAGGYTNYFPNGYPFIIALFKSIAGTYAVDLLLWLNIILSVCCIWFIYDISKRLFKIEALALLTAFILAVFPTQINYVRWLTSEVPVSFFLIGAYYFYFRKQNWLSGLFFGLATVIRTELLPVFILLIVFEIFIKKKFNFQAITAALIPILFICTYCYAKTGSFSMAGHGRVNLMYSITAKGSYVDWYYIDKHPEINTNAKAMKAYIDHAKEDPGDYIKTRFINFWELWGFYPSSSEGNRGTASRLMIGACNFFLVIFGLYGWWRNRKFFNIGILLLPFIIVTGVHILLLALPRYTYPVEPFMMLLATWTLWIMARKVAKPQRNLSASAS